MCTINKQKELCEDRIVTWDQTKYSNCACGNGKRRLIFLLKSSVLKLTIYMYFKMSRTKCKNLHFPGISSSAKQLPKINRYSRNLRMHTNHVIILLYYYLIFSKFYYFPRRKSLLVPPKINLKSQFSSLMGF